MKSTQNKLDNPASEEVSSSDTLRRIFSENFNYYRKSYALAIFCMFAIAGTTALMAYLLRDIANEVFQKLDVGAADALALTVLIIFTVRGFATFGQDVILNRIGNNIVARYQKKIYAHMLKLGVDFYSGTRSAYLVGQINQNLAGVRTMLNLIITVFVRDLLTFCALVSVMIYMSPLLALGALVVLPIIGFVLSRYVKKIKALARNEVAVNSRVISAMTESAQGISVVKAFTMEKVLSKKIASDIDSAEARANGIALVNARTKPLTEILGGLAIAGVIAFGGRNVISNGADPGSMLSFLASALLAYDPGRRLASFRVKFEKTVVNARMMFELLDTPPRQADKEGAVDFVIKKGAIAFKKVNFSYNEDEPTLKDVSITVPAGKTIALVGPSGGGKTTLINLALRFYDLQSGTIEFDGQNISDVKVAGLRQNMALVSQSPVLFEGSVADNLRYAKPDASESEIVAAAKLAQADEFIMEMPQGYETLVGEMGSNLSGGQRQRLSIARALLRDAKILLLDEATSALDNKSEKLVQRAIDNLTKGRTTIVVAHRLSTIRNADKIVVIDQGRVKEQGTHDELMGKSRGLYANLNNIDSNLEVPAAKKGKTK